MQRDRDIAVVLLKEFDRARNERRAHGCQTGYTNMAGAKIANFERRRFKTVHGKEGIGHFFRKQLTFRGDDQSPTNPIEKQKSE